MPWARAAKNEDILCKLYLVLASCRWQRLLAQIELQAIYRDEVKDLGQHVSAR